MITLITGTPGAGKTAYAMDLMLRQIKLDNSRKLYVHGIPNLKVPHEIIVCSSSSCDVCPSLPKKIRNDSDSVVSMEWGDSENFDVLNDEIDYKKVEDWHEYAENGSIFFLDEVQNIHRVRSSGSAVPPAVAAYEVHRHRGLDFFIVTQNPSLIDGNVRALVSRHIHLTSSFARRIQYEYPTCKTDLTGTVGEGIKSTYKLPTHVFDLYKSSSLHTTVTRKKPFFYFLFPVVLLVFFGFAYTSYNKFKSKPKPKSDPISAPTPTPTPTPLQNPPLSATSSHAGTGGTQGTDGHGGGQTSKRRVDLPRLFLQWSNLGIGDDDLKFLPVGMCAVSSSKFVKCKFGSNLSFKHFFTNISCTPTDCFAFLTRILPVNTAPREPITAPNLPFIEPLKTASSE